MSKQNILSTRAAAFGWRLVCLVLVALAPVGCGDGAVPQSVGDAVAGDVGELGDVGDVGGSRHPDAGAEQDGLSVNPTPEAGSPDGAPPDDVVGQSGQGGPADGSGPRDVVPSEPVSLDARPAVSDGGAKPVDAVAPLDAAAPDGPALDMATPDAAFVPRPDPETLPLFDESRVLDFHVSFPPGEWERLLSLRGEAPTRWVRCTFRFEAVTFADASCRRKGNMFDWDRTAAKPQFVVRFNLSNPAGRFLGMRRLNFENFSGWAAPVRDRLGMWLMRESGIDAPRVNHARVFKDGALLGVYQNVEVIDKELLEDHFGPDSDGNLWEGGVELETNETTGDHSKRLALDALIEAEPLEGDHTAFYARLAALMDMDQVLREMAGETALIAKDNFSNNLKNYYYYEHPRRGFQVLPWDFDDVLVPVLVDADPFIFSSHAPPSKLRLLINQNPVWRASYVEHLIDIRDKVLARMPAYLDTVCAQIRGAVAEDKNTFYTLEEFDRGCAELQVLIPNRIAALKRMLGR